MKEIQLNPKSGENSVHACPDCNHQWCGQSPPVCPRCLSKKLKRYRLLAKDCGPKEISLAIMNPDGLETGAIVLPVKEAQNFLENSWKGVLDWGAFLLTPKKDS